jgi:hypothetical protein
VLYMQDNASIHGNSNSSTGDAAAVYFWNASTSSKAVFSGSAKVYDNTNGSGSRANVGDVSTLNTGTQIQVAEEGLNDDAEIGVYSTSNYKAGNTFARTETSPSSGYGNLSAFVNDKNTRLTGYAGTDDRVIWSSKERLVLKKELPAASAHDSWFVVSLKNTVTGEVYRQAIEVPAGSTSGTATVAVQSGVAYEVGDCTEMGEWRYSTSATSLAKGAEADEDTWTTTGATAPTLGTLTLVPATAADPATPATLTMTQAGVSGAQGWISDTSSVTNTIDVS